MELYYKRGAGMLSEELMVTTEDTGKEETVYKNEQKFLEELMYAQWPRDKEYSNIPEKVQERYSVCNVNVSDLSIRNYTFDRIDFSNCLFLGLVINKNRFVKCTFTDCMFVRCTFVTSVFSECTESATSFDNCMFNSGVVSLQIGNMCSFNECIFNDTDVFFEAKEDAKVFIEECCLIAVGLRLKGGEYIIKKCSFSESCIEDKSKRIEHDIPLACPVAGSFIAYKVALATRSRVIVTLRIPEDAKRSSCVGRKCRASKAEVLSIKSFDGGERYEKAYSNHTTSFIYQVGATVEPQRFINMDTCTETGAFDENRFNECSTGIHFFLSPEEAIDYAKEHF